MFVKALSMCQIPFLKDGLYLGPETEAVEKPLEGLPREIIWLESLSLEENREDCVEGDDVFRDTLNPRLTVSQPPGSRLPPATLGGSTLMTLSAVAQLWPQSSV